MKSRHFHLGAAAVLGAIAVAMTIHGWVAIGCFSGLGALVALLHWKAAKIGLIE